jgi:hypothetical protein
MPLYQWLSHEAERRAQDVPTVIETLLEEYARQYDLTQTQTWRLCGAFTVAEPEPEYTVGSDEAGSPITNYAEHVDEALCEEA